MKKRRFGRSYRANWTTDLNGRLRCIGDIQSNGSQVRFVSVAEEAGQVRTTTGHRPFPCGSKKLTGPDTDMVGFCVVLLSPLTQRGRHSHEFALQRLNASLRAVGADPFGRLAGLPTT